MNTLRAALWRGMIVCLAVITAFAVADISPADSVQVGLPLGITVFALYLLEE